MSAASTTLRVLDGGFGWLWNIAGTPSPLEVAAIDAETTEAIRRAGGGETEINQARREAAAVHVLNQPKGCKASVADFLSCADTTRKVLTFVFVAGVVVLVAPYIARAWREFRKK